MNTVIVSSLPGTYVYRICTKQKQKIPHKSYGYCRENRKTEMAIGKAWCLNGDKKIAEKNNRIFGGHRPEKLMMLMAVYNFQSTLIFLLV